MEANTPDNIRLSNRKLDLVLNGSRGLKVARYALPSGATWVNEASGSSVFAVYFDAKRVDGQNDGLVVRNTGSSSFACTVENKNVPST